MNKTAWIIIGILCLLGLGGAIALSKKSNVNVAEVDPYSVIASNADTIGDHVFGNQNAKVKVIEYGDYQCPGCGAAAASMPKIQATYKDKVLFIFRNYPLTTIHPNALAAATVAEAAGLQGKFWEMHDLLYSSQSEWTTLSADQRAKTFDNYASQLGMNIDAFHSDLTNKSIQTKIRSDRALGDKVGVSGTPTFYVNSQKADDQVTSKLLNRDPAAFMDKLDEALKANNETPPIRS